MARCETSCVDENRDKPSLADSSNGAGSQPTGNITGLRLFSHAQTLKSRFFAPVMSFC